MLETLEQELTASHCTSDWMIRVGLTPLSEDRPYPVAVVQILSRKEKTKCLTGKRPISSTQPSAVLEQIRTLTQSMIPVAREFLEGFKK